VFCRVNLFTVISIVVLMYFRGAGMSNQNLPNENADEKTEEQVDRRTVVGRAGKFLAYTAPALIALITAKHRSLRRHPSGRTG